MELKIGLWLDNRKAVIVSISGKKEKIISINSNVEEYHKDLKGCKIKNKYGSKDFTAYDIVEKDMEEHLKKYFNKIISQIKNADIILIFGPGKAKQELSKYIEKYKFMSRKIEVVTSAKMSDNEILSKVRQYYETDGVKGKRHSTVKVVSKIVSLDTVA